MALPIEAADAVRACLEAALATRDTPPAETCLRAGSEVPLNIGTNSDECCSGLAWVRVQQIEPVVSLTTEENPCQTTGFVITLELGVARCSPFGTAAAGPDCLTWTNLAILMDNDAAAMREAVCCYATAVAEEDPGLILSVRPGVWLPLDSSGGCAGGTMQATVTFDCSEC